MSTMKQHCFTVNETVSYQLETEAKQLGMSKGAWLQMMIDCALQKQNNDTLNLQTSASRNGDRIKFYVRLSSDAYDKLQTIAKANNAPASRVLDALVQQFKFELHMEPKELTNE